MSWACPRHCSSDGLAYGSVPACPRRGEIGPLCGYGDETYFKIIFRRAYGKSMRDYRRDARKG